MKKILSAFTLALMVLTASYSINSAFAKGGNDEGEIRQESRGQEAELRGRESENEIRGHDAEVAAGLEAERHEDEIRGHDAEVAAGLETERHEDEIRGHDAEVAAGLEADDIRREDRREDRRNDFVQVISPLSTSTQMENVGDDRNRRGRGEDNQGRDNATSISMLEEMIKNLVKIISELENQVHSLIGR